jgi:hypothetical protein
MGQHPGGPQLQARPADAPVGTQLKGVTQHRAELAFQIGTHAGIGAGHQGIQGADAHHNGGYAAPGHEPRDQGAGTNGRAGVAERGWGESGTGRR